MNNRKIRFRAWHIKDKKMITWIELIANYHWLNILHDPKAYKIELMQYTGLKDRNQNPIYEGDIIKYVTQTAEILPINPNFLVQTINGKVNITRFSHLYEIVGNIYQNPELLNGDTKKC